MSSLDRILPFLRPIEDLLVDPTITEVMVNGGGRRIFVERDGSLEAVSDRTLEIRNLTVAIKNIARACGDEISESAAASGCPARGWLARRCDVSALLGRRPDTHHPEVHAPVFAGRTGGGRNADGRLRGRRFNGPSPLGRTCSSQGGLAPEKRRY